MSGGLRWVVYSTFDASGASTSVAVDQIRSYREAGFDVLVVDTSPSLSEQRREDWEREATRWLHRENRGHDFASYREGLRILERLFGSASRHLAIILANDSCYGPFVPFAEFVDAFDAFPLDRRYVFGMTDSDQVVHHLQSYWLYFRPDVCKLAFEFFATMPTAEDRAAAIELGELALGRFLVERGCRLHAACPVHATVAALATARGPLLSALELGARRILRRWKYNRDADTQCLRYLLRRPSNIRHFNPAMLFAVPLVRQGKLPLMKRSVFTRNPYRDPVVPAGLAAPADNAEIARLLDPRRPREARAFHRR
jgi:hypothetical protein